MKTLRNLLLLFLLGYLFTGVAQIRPEERAIVKRFGRIVSRPGPGLWVGLPWGIDRIERIPLATLRRVTVGYSPESEGGMLAGQLLTGDQNLVNLQVAIDYSVAEGDLALDAYLNHRDRVEAILTREGETLLAEWVAGRSVDEVLLLGSAELPRFLIARLQAQIEPLKIGIRIQQASVVSLTPLDEVRSAFDEVNRSQTAIRTQEFRARQESEQKLQSARSEKFRLEQEAITVARQRRLLAETEAESFRKRFQSYQLLGKNNPNFLHSLWWDEMGQTLFNLRTRGRIDLLDPYLGADGLDITQFISPVPRRLEPGK